MAVTSPICGLQAVLGYIFAVAAVLLTVVLLGWRYAILTFHIDRDRNNALRLVTALLDIPIFGGMAGRCGSS